MFFVFCRKQRHVYNQFNTVRCVHSKHVRVPSKANVSHGVLNLVSFSLTRQMLRNFPDGNRDHLLSQARSELMKQEHQVESLNNRISELFRNKLMLKDWNYRTRDTEMLSLDENLFVYMTKYLRKKTFSEILKSEVCTNWEK